MDIKSTQRVYYTTSTRSCFGFIRCHLKSKQRRVLLRLKATFKIREVITQFVAFHLSTPLNHYERQGQFNTSVFRNSFLSHKGVSLLKYSLFPDVYIIWLSVKFAKRNQILKRDNFVVLFTTKLFIDVPTLIQSHLNVMDVRWMFCVHSLCSNYF